jgi:DNA polymerase-3 subunit delta'
MKAFQQVIGHEEIKIYFEKSLKANKIGHSYIFEGPKGVGRKLVTKAFSKMLLCENKEDAGDTSDIANKPCGHCKGCMMLEKETHPDYIVVPKDTKVTKIDTIREKLVKNMEVKPYQAPYKVVVIEDADSLTIEGQNAMLKTIEEPPSYGITILITTNKAKLLPTIVSRCITLRFTPLTPTEVESYLAHKDVSPQNKAIYKQFSGGSIGVLEELMKDGVFMEKRQRAISYREQLEKADLMQLYDLVKEFTENKEEIEEILEFWILWQRDLAVTKTKSSQNLYYPDYQSMLLGNASKLTYNKISMDLELIQKAKGEIDQNIYTTFIIENLFLKLKERKK